MAKLSINTEELLSEFFEDTRLLGIVTTEKDYRYCWNLNTFLGMNFRSTGFDIQLIKKRREYFFPVYEYKMENTMLCHYLYNNLYDGEYLLPEFKNLDFLWLMKYDPVTDEYVQNLKQLLRDIPGVQLVTEITDEKIKNKEYLIF